MHYNFDDPGDLSVWEVSTDPDHPVAYDFDFSTVGGVLFAILWILYACFIVAMLVGSIVACFR